MEKVTEVDSEEIKKIRGSSLLSVFPWRLPNSQLMSLMTQKQGELEANKQNRKKHFRKFHKQQAFEQYQLTFRNCQVRFFFHVGFLLWAQIPLCDSGTNRFGSSSEQFDWLGTDHHCAQFCFEKSWSDLLQGFTDNCHRAATRIQTPSARDGNLDKCGNVIPFWRKFPVPTEIGSWP